MEYGVYMAEGGDFLSRVTRVLEACGRDGRIARLVFFGCPADNGEYSEQKRAVGGVLRARFGAECPAWSYVAQKPLGAELLLEVWRADVAFEGEVSYKTLGDLPYVLLRGRCHSELVAGGFCGTDIDAPAGAQAEEAMDGMGRLLREEGFAVDGIVRQWNYLERITAFDGERQRYQAFNEARSRFYACGRWREGYPAATGIGTRWGGVVIDFTAVRTEGEGCRCVPLDNALQVAAHGYSRRVLPGRLSADAESVTPKFERAKLWEAGGNRVIYLSGTAAIRGEESAAGADVLRQTETTLENIDFLLSGDTLRGKGCAGEGAIRTVRVYLKRPEDWTAVKAVLSRRLQGIPAAYLEADVCREELLIEIEGVADVR